MKLYQTFLLVMKMICDDEDIIEDIDPAAAYEEEVQDGRKA